MNKTYKDNLAKFVKDPKPGQYLVFQEYIDGHGGGQYPVVDIISFDDDCETYLEDTPDEPDDDCETYLEDTPDEPRLREVNGWCDSTGYDGIVTLELWDNGEAYLSGDGVGHPRYRVVGIEPVSITESVEDEELTNMSGVPHYWGLWMQDSWDDKPGTKVEYCLNVYENSEWHWQSRKEFGNSSEEVDALVTFARAELSKPKYCGLHTKVVVGGNVVYDSRP